uniref:uncharacterized protein LOC108950592 isoform X2 n=1 Tax=Ciona intestinalis TaxID=7719 RepID=UPI000EF55287|nr:uncharacterized protein LOC108950592 isoform X2 [Ciona intestinalis]|eukprot:XP_026695299.1 uncharacterized protein LOC108950592 isoform X2 [Ciona intestinalis]
MDWDYFTAAMFAVAVTLSTYYGSSGAQFKVVESFNCNDPRSVERIHVSSPCGAVASPCYPQPTPELGEGRKGWVVDAGGWGRKVAGYRLSFQDFNIGDQPSTFIIGKAAETLSNGLLNVTGDITVNGQIDGGITVVENGRKTLKTNENFLDVDFMKIFLTFNTSGSTTDQGQRFYITFCADFDKCSDHEEYCKHGGTCVRDGFKKYRCKCKAGFIGNRCESDRPPDGECNNAEGGDKSKGRVKLCESSRCIKRLPPKETEELTPMETTPAKPMSPYSSYLGFPRVNFGGEINFDASTNNNQKCTFDNEFFSVSELSKDYVIVGHETNRYNRYPTEGNNWNPDGGNHFRFYNTTVTSTCTSNGRCSTTDAIVGAVLKGATTAVLVDFDVDWQIVPGFWGLTVHIPGMFRGKFTPSRLQRMSVRNTTSNTEGKGYTVGLAGRYKSKLTDVEWESEYYKKMFKSVDTLSIRFVLDLYDQFSHNARITGSIGLTSDLDPLETTGERLLIAENPNLAPAPFCYVDNSKHALLSIDLSMIFEADLDGNFDTSASMYLGILPFICSAENLDCITPLSIEPIKLNDGAWYNVYGGITDLRFQSTIVDINHRLVIYMEDGKKKRTLVAVEPEHGIQIGLTNNLGRKLNVGEQAEFGAFVTKLGRPVVGASLDIGVVAANSSTDCGRPTCHKQ